MSRLKETVGRTSGSPGRLDSALSAHFCSNCGAPLDAQQSFCGSCGQPVTNPRFPPVPVPVPAEAPDRTSGLAPAGWAFLLIGVIFPFLEVVPIVIGIILMTRDRVEHGALMMGLALTIGVVRALLYFG